jgi:outer membrane protein TolC
MRHRYFYLSYFYLTLYILSLGVIATLAVANESDTKSKLLSLNLHDALQLALKKSPLLVEAKARINQAESDYASSLSALLPNVSGNVEQNR